MVDHVVVAVPADRIDQAEQLLAGRATVVAGGANRIESVTGLWRPFPVPRILCWCMTPHEH